MNENILKSIKSLPALDSTAVEVQRVCGDSSSGIGDLAAVIAKDPMLTANILRYANSPLYGFSRQISSVEQAVGLFGMATVRGFVLRDTINRLFKVDLSPYNATPDDFTRITAMQNVVAFNWYGRINREALGIISPASFMMEIGKILIAKELIDSGRAAQFSEALESISSPFDLEAVEIEFEGVSNEEVTACIFERWNMEKELIDAIAFSSHPEKAPQNLQAICQALMVVKAAVNIFGVLGDDGIKKSCELLKGFGGDVEQFCAITDRLK